MEFYTKTNTVSTDEHVWPAHGQRCLPFGLGQVVSQNEH